MARRRAVDFLVSLSIPRQSQEKISLLRTLGAEVFTVPEKPHSDPDNYDRIAQRLAQEKVSP
jgi:cysteine synthase